MTDWEEISETKALTEYKDKNAYQHVVHCMLLFDGTDAIKYGFIQFRADGLLGVPGGVVDEQITGMESLMYGLMREMNEEINYSYEDIVREDYMYSHYNSAKQMISHFFAKQISTESAERLERNHMNARDFPKESLGLLRIPVGCQSLYWRRFMTHFMRQQFVESDIFRKQILDVCTRFKTMPKTDLDYIKSRL